MNTSNISVKRSFILTLTTLTLAACAMTSQTSGSRSSVVDYLYPDSEQREVSSRIPHLSLPLRVGVAFVPSAERYATNGYSFSAMSSFAGLTEQDKQSLLEQVAGNFRDLDYVKKVEVIPSAYLRAAGSFANMRQIQTMYGVDVMALVSHDQVQFTDQDLLSISYWTIVGAYLVNGEKNDTNTLLDTVVYDINSEQLLFRAPGNSHVSGRTTPVNLSEELREDSREGFQLATTEMISNLKSELDRFEERVKTEPGKVQISHSGGGGAVSLLGFAALLLLFLMRRPIQLAIEAS